LKPRRGTSSSGSDLRSFTPTGGGSSVIDDFISGEEFFGMDEMDDADRKSKPVTSEKTYRLVKWTSDLLARSLERIVARRMGIGAPITSVALLELRRLEVRSRSSSDIGRLVSDEVVEVINLPNQFEDKAPLPKISAHKSKLSSEVERQLHQYICTVAAMYHDDNPFHNFEHASHVAMSTSKV
jgi:hypothetical protein